ncbi:MAG TPA: hypothetical protein VGC45_06190 [Gryllotalpicola sp.]
MTLDTVHGRSAFDAEVALEHDTGLERARDAIQRLKRIAKDTGAAVWIAHDPDDGERFAAPCRLD